MSPMSSHELDGRWLSTKGDHVCDIIRGVIKFADGGETHLIPTAKDEYSIILNSSVFVGRASFAGKLDWSDGDTWFRETEAKGVEGGGSKKAEGSNDQKGNESEQLCLDTEITDTGDRCEYRVLQGVVFKKKGKNPKTDKGIKMTRSVGSTLRCTGREFQGQDHSLWVELDNIDSPGWILVKGESLGIPGQLLEKVQMGEEEPIILKVAEPSQSEESKQRDICIRASCSIQELKAWISLYFKVKASMINICKPQSQRPSNNKVVAWHNLGSEEFVQNNVSIQSAGFRHLDSIAYVYMGYLGDDSP